MDSDIENSYKSFLERNKTFKHFGYDIDKERDAIISKADPIGEKILEIGTGKGYLTIALAAKGYSLSTLDISQEEQKIAKNNIKYLHLSDKVEFYTGDACSLPFEKKSFHSIFCINTFHHIKDCFDVLSEFLRVCHQKGKIIISDFNDKGLSVVASIHKSEGRTHKAFRVPWREMERFLKRAGFAVEFFETMHQKALIANKDKDGKQ